jgi:hypothetical protein
MRPMRWVSEMKPYILVSNVKNMPEGTSAVLTSSEKSK